MDEDKKNYNEVDSEIEYVSDIEEIVEEAVIDHTELAKGVFTKQLALVSDESKQAEFLEQLRPFAELMMQYRCALMEIETKFKVLNEEFSLQYNRNPFESIKTRIKSPLSIIDKTRRKHIEMSLEGIERNMFDIAGVRVICSFPEDIYILADMLIKQDDVILVEKKDYIRFPKENGYRSLHLIVDVPIFLSHEKKHMKVEVQFRTIAMDFWASLEHKLKYKQNIPDADIIAKELKKCADTISDMDYKMQDIRHMIDFAEHKNTTRV